MVVLHGIDDCAPILDPPLRSIPLINLMPGSEPNVISCRADDAVGHELFGNRHELPLAVIPSKSRPGPPPRPVRLDCGPPRHRPDHPGRILPHLAHHPYRRLRNAPPVVAIEMKRGRFPRGAPKTWSQSESRRGAKNKPPQGCPPRRGDTDSRIVGVQWQREARTRWSRTRLMKSVSVLAGYERQ
jgi:hypothetical protein